MRKGKPYSGGGGAVSRKKIRERINESDRKQALIQYLGYTSVADIDRIQQFDKKFETPDGEYLVVSQEEAYPEFRERIENYLDNLDLDYYNWAISVDDATKRGIILDEVESLLSDSYIPDWFMKYADFNRLRVILINANANDADYLTYLKKEYGDGGRYTDIEDYIYDFDDKTLAEEVFEKNKKILGEGFLAKVFHKMLDKEYDDDFLSYLLESSDLDDLLYKNLITVDYNAIIKYLWDEEVSGTGGFLNTRDGGNAHAALRYNGVEFLIYPQ